jgi:hypothetical protein
MMSGNKAVNKNYGMVVVRFGHSSDYIWVRINFAEGTIKNLVDEIQNKLVNLGIEDGEEISFKEIKLGLLFNYQRITDVSGAEDMSIDEFLHNQDANQFTSDHFSAQNGTYSSNEACKAPLFSLSSITFPQSTDANMNRVNEKDIQIKLELGHTLEHLFANAGSYQRLITPRMLNSHLLSINLTSMSSKFNFQTMEEGVLIKGSNWSEGFEFFGIVERYKLYALTITAKKTIVQGSNSKIDQTNLYFWDEEKGSFYSSDLT